MFDTQKSNINHRRQDCHQTRPNNQRMRITGVCFALMQTRFWNVNYALKTIWVDDNYVFNARSMDVLNTKLRKLLKDDPESKSSAHSR